MRRDANELRVKAQPPRHKRQRNRKNTTRNHELARDLQERYIAAERPRSLALATTRVPPKGVSDVLVHYLDQCCIDRLVRRVVYFVYKINSHSKMTRLQAYLPSCLAAWLSPAWLAAISVKHRSSDSSNASSSAISTW